MKGKLRVNDYRVWANHGWYPEERKLGAEYRIDVELSVLLPDANMTLDDTVDYQQVVYLVDVEMKKEFKLIEESCTSIFQSLIAQFNTITQLSVTVTKLNIPINNLNSTSFTVSK